jgi:hypothetical protein
MNKQPIKLPAMMVTHPYPLLATPEQMDIYLYLEKYPDLEAKCREEISEKYV